MLRGDQLEVVSHFKYLSSVFSSDCTLNAEITHHIAAANSAFQQLRRANIWSSRALTLSLKMHRRVCFAVLWRNVGCRTTHYAVGCFSDEQL